MNKPLRNSHFHGLRTVIYRTPDLDKAKAWYYSSSDISMFNLIVPSVLYV